MANKVIIIILVFLVVISGGLGAYSYLLSQQIGLISGQLASLQQEQSVRLGAIGDGLSAFRLQTTSNINILKGDIGGASTRMDNLQMEVGTLRDDIKEIDDIATGLSQSVLSADMLYQMVVAASARIGDGDRLVGSGFVYDNNGHVVTANHVVENLSTVYVTLADGRSSTATVVGGSEASDVAVLKLDDAAISVEPPTTGDSSQMKIGESVIAIGNPFGLTETLTSGIVSHMNRFVKITSDSGDRWIANLIQYDAAVNPGNSGGPLFNASGEVIGLVTARVDPNRGEGIYYAVSSNKFKRVADQLIESGSFDYPWVGINISNITPREAGERNLDTTNGVVVKGILPGSPAEGSEIRTDDIIVGVDTMVVNNVSDLTSYLGEHKSPDETASFTLFRHAVKMDVSLEIGRRPS
ncbi:S1C family serine protease [Bacteroidota bacterium]